MDRRMLSVWVGAPGLLLAASCLVALLARSPWWFIAVFVALLTATLWSLAGLRRPGSEAAEDALVASYNVQLSALVAAACALLTLAFIGAPLMVVVIVAEFAWSVDAARRVWDERQPARVRGVHEFKKRARPV